MNIAPLVPIPTWTPGPSSISTPPPSVVLASRQFLSRSLTVARGQSIAGGRQFTEACKETRTLAITDTALVAHTLSPIESYSPLRHRITTSLEAIGSAMEYRNRGRGRMMAEHLRARQTTAQATNTPTKSPSKTPTIPQPTSFVALTTAFNPPSSCFENLLTMMPPPGYMIWANEPVPVANQTVAACYPPEFIQDYKSVSSGDVGSSVVPAMSPFVCPKNYCTMLAEAKNYIACCPS